MGPSPRGEAARSILQAKAPQLVRFADDAQGEDKAILEYTSSALGSASAASAAHQLSEGVVALETALRQEVLARHSEMVQHVARCVGDHSHDRRRSPQALT